MLNSHSKMLNIFFNTKKGTTNFGDIFQDVCDDIYHINILLPNK